MPDLHVLPRIAFDNSAGLNVVGGVHETNRPRDINLVIQRKGETFCLKVVTSTALSSAFPDPLRESDVPLTPAKLWGAVRRCRAVWRTNVVDARRGSEYLFQKYWDFSNDASALESCLGSLAVAGSELFNDIFYPVEVVDDKQTYAVLTGTGDALRALARKQSLWIRVTSDEFYAPWNLLYSAELSDKRDGKDAVLDGFWGYRHVVEHVPERAQRGTDLKISAPIRAALYLDTEIDKDTEVACNQVVEDELSGYGAQALNLDRMTTSAEMMRSLVRPLTQHLVYFCCHASLEGDGTRIDAEDAYLALTDRDYRIGPSRLNSWLGQSLFTSGPVVFMNACESGQMNSLFYQGFVPTFLNRRASALIGAQTEIPAVFAGQFAKSFLARFFSGGSNNVVGQILFDLRRNFIDVQKNPLGLLYCVYRGADVHLASALVREPPAKNGGQGI
jgi:hypothetical protein